MTFPLNVAAPEAPPPSPVSEATTTGVPLNAKWPGATSPELSPESVTSPESTADKTPDPLTFALNVRLSEAVYDSVEPSARTISEAAANLAAPAESATVTSPSTLITPSTVSGRSPAAQLNTAEANANAQIPFVIFMDFISFNGKI